MSITTGDLLEAPFGSADLSRPARRRALRAYVAMIVAGLLPVLLDLSPHWQTAGLGLMLPGGGFLAAQHYWFFVATLALMFVAYVLFQLMANVFAIIAVWAGSLIVSVRIVPVQVDSPSVVVVLAAVGAFGLLGFLISRSTIAREQQRLVNRNRYLPKAMDELRAAAAQAPQPGSRELSPGQLAHLRYCIERGLQPVNSFDGFDVIEQFQTSALRYQLNYLLWGLQVTQCHYMPNFHGYLSEAQRNLIDKLTVPRVWKWWRWESLFGNFSLNFDPIAKDNIMFGAFSSANIALYTAITGDQRYMQPGSLTFVEDEWQRYEHSLPTILEAGRKNHRLAAFAPLYPCEPRLTYSACNVWGNIGHLVGDRIFDTDYGQQLSARLKRAHVSEMLGADGSPHSGRINWLGVRMPVYTCNFVAAQWAWMAAPFFADLTLRTWAVLRDETVGFDSDGRIHIDTRAYDRIDIGNYKRSDAAVYAHYLVLAQELGDYEVADAIMAKFENDYGRTDNDGIIAYADVSNHTNAVMILGQLLRCEDIRHMVLHGPEQGPLTGPLLEGAAYPDVLVAKAYSDGRDLDLVLYPGDTSPEQKLVISRLTPDMTYEVGVTGEESYTVDAGPNGRTELTVVLKGRTEIVLTPLGH